MDEPWRVAYCRLINATLPTAIRTRNALLYCIFPRSPANIGAPKECLDLEAPSEADLGQSIIHIYVRAVT